MSSALVLLILGVVALVFVVYIFIAKHKFKIVSLEMRQKILIEDALKFIFDCDYKEIPCTQTAIAGHLGKSTNEILAIVNNLIKEDYISWGGKNIMLNDTGREAALKVIRRHRLWESHLAQNSSVSELEWHQSADEQEHFMSPEETDALAAKIGNPVMDPHGDPIPSKDGFMHEEEGVLLLNLNEGDSAEIVHIEDEPHDIYKEIVAKGFGLGHIVKIKEKSKSQMVLISKGKHITLPLPFCQNLTTKLISDFVEEELQYETLASLKKGEEAEIVGLSSSLRGLQRRRLLDFGIVKGSRIVVDLESPFRNPIGYRVLGTTLALRRKQTEMIFIKRC